MRQWLAALTLVGCSPSSPPAPVEPPVYETASATAASEPSASAPVISAPSARPSAPTADVPLAFPCAKDADCGWDDPCLPVTCVAKSATHPAACEESSPPDGTCTCMAGVCSKKPKYPVTATGTCEPGACVIDYGRGRCIADTAGVMPELRSVGPVDEGPSCDCINPNSGCQFNWFDAIPCESNLSCWVSLDPRPRPVRRRPGLGRPFKPCIDGEHEPVCKKGKCTVGAHYKC